MTGASGLIGGALRAALEADGHAVTPLVRAKGQDGVHWDPVAGTVDSAGLEGIDVVYHLAGENISAGRWTHARKELIRESRCRGTSVLASALSGLKSKPKVMVCASAVGFYGGCDDSVDETSGPGGDFLSQVCMAWEEAALPAAHAGIRVAHARLGVVLTPKGGALSEMLPWFKCFLGGRIGSGEQWMSWVSLDDAVAALRFIADDDSFIGPVNVTAPAAATNMEFTAALGHVLRRPTLAPLPAPMVRLLFGEMGESLLLSGAHVLPARLQKEGFRFKHPELVGALRHLLGR
ncbi:MAG: TIGR01777 family protein [Elusimicrobia bacterium]|nr:TIGR01777 family protein [Elusimicrobiota bacterium]